MTISPDAFRTISEVADWLGIQAHVLRFWESKFAQVKPVKRAGGRRYYRPADMLLLGGIRKLLYDDGLTIKGVQKILREQGVAHVSEMSHPMDDLMQGTEDEAVSTVLRFQSRSARAGRPLADAPPDEQIEALADIPEDEEEDEELAQYVPPTFAATEDRSDDGSGDADGDADAAEDEDEDAEPAQVAPALPSFLSRAARAEPAATPAQQPRILAVDAPDPPPEDSLSASPGALSRACNLTRLSPEQMAAIAPLAEALRNWRDTAATARR